jgi:amino acid adenylation domain-containing protein
VYLITGGLGGIGLVLAEYLAGSVGAKLVLTGRSPFPARQQWEEWLISPDKDPRVCNKIRKLLEIEKMGSHILVVSADVSHLEQVQKVFTRAEEKFGKINGVIHSAGLTGETMYRAVKEISKADCHRQFKPKIYGTLVLETLLQDRDVDFCLLMSSTSAILGGLGLAAYSAANSFMDAMSHRHKKTTPTPWISVNWDGWQVGEEKKQEQAAFLGQRIVELSMTPAEGVKAFQRILSFAGAAQIIQSAEDLQARIQQWIKRESLDEEDMLPGKKPDPRGSRPLLQVPYAPPRTREEQVLARIWGKISGYEQVGIRDNFFELGGDSLKAVTIVSKIHQALDIQLSLKCFFTYPTIEGLAQRIVNTKKSQFFSIGPVEKKEYYTLSSAQKRLYILQRMEEKSTAYNIPQVVKLKGDLDRGKLENTFRRLIQRHESLRTSFHMAAELPVQRIRHEVEFKIVYYEPGKEGTRGLAPLPIKNFIRPFDLSRAPLLRVGLIKEKEDNHILIVDMHHIISDGVSNNIFTRDFMALYPDNAAPIPKLLIQYKDFSEWQKRVKEKIMRQEAFWLKQFEDEIPVLQLPVDYSRPPIQSFQGSTTYFAIDKEQTRCLRKLAAAEGATLFMVLMALYNVMLSKISGQEDIIVGTPIAARRHTDLEQIIGMFVNTLVIRSYPLAEKKFRDFLKEVKERSLGAFENQEYPFEELVDRALVKRDVSRNPLFDVMFDLQDMENSQLDVPGLKLKPYDYEDHISKFDISLTALETVTGDHLAFACEYCTKLFNKETIQRFTGYFKQLLADVIKNPDKKLWEIDIINETEKNQLLFEFNQTAAEYPKNKTVHELFRRQAVKRPDRTALVGVGIKNPIIATDSPKRFIHITYKQLDKTSDGLSHLLREKGAEPGTIVGIMIERSVEMVFGLLGILKSGAAYLPIDPGYPRERINYLLKDSGAQVLLTDSANGITYKKSIVCIPDAMNRCFIPTMTHLHLPPTPVTSLAFIIYTSGSTGSPRGVLVEHRNIMAYFCALLGVCNFTSTDIILQRTSFIFDAHIEEIFPVLLKGGRTVIPPKQVILDTHLLMEVAAKSNITIISYTPMLLNVLNKDPEGVDKLATVHTHLVGGDVLKKEYIGNFLKKSIVLNGYGPTEITVAATCYRCHDGAPDNIPIGKPIANYRVYILSEKHCLQPIGVIGEMYIAGPGVTRGYLNNPELTVEKFILAANTRKEKRLVGIPEGRKIGNSSPIALSPSPLYKTGDLARCLQDGNIEFLGRIDYQVKIRGFRIELGEIESQLLTHKDIIAAEVILRGSSQGGTLIEPGGKYLCAYIVCAKGIITAGAFKHMELKKYLSLTLPGYMIPAYFIQLEKIPLTSNGKIDRKALPAPETKAGADFVAPRDQIEEKLVETWAEVIARDPSHASQLRQSIGIDDDFFQLGGHSLKATMLLSKLQKTFNIKIPLVEIFRLPTIRQLAETLEQRSPERENKNGYKSQEPAMLKEAIQPVEKKEYYPISASQRRFLIIETVTRAVVTFNMMEAMIIEGPFDKTRFQEAFLSLVHRHETLRTSFALIRGTPVQIIHPGLEIKMEYHETAGETKIKQLVNDFVKPFDMYCAPLFRLGVIKVENLKHILMMDMHHIISDGVSGKILLQDLIALYQKEKLAPLVLQFKDYAQWQNSKGQIKILEKQEEFWLSRFDGPPPLLNLPTDYPPPPHRDFAGRSMFFEINGEPLTALKRMIQQKDVTLYITLLSIYNILLAKYTGQETILVGTVVAGRFHADLQHIAGVFVNVLVMINHPAGNKPFGDFLREVKDNSLKAFENQDYQFDELVKNLDLKMDPSRDPLVDAQFTVQNIDATVMNSDELNILPYSHLENKITKWVLDLIAVESHDKIVMRLNYSTRLYKESTARKITAHFTEILEQVLRDENMKLKDISISFDTTNKTKPFQEDSLDFEF